MKIGSMKVFTGFFGSQERMILPKSLHPPRMLVKVGGSLHVWHGVPEIHLPNGWTFSIGTC